jgi:hypothetical protein
MRLVRCDECLQEVSQETWPFTHDFCSRECFERWIGRREGLKLVDDHREKFASLFDLVEKARADKISKVVIAEPGVLGDNYAEVLTNLDMLAAAKLEIVIVPPEERGKRS